MSKILPSNWEEKELRKSNFKGEVIYCKYNKDGGSDEDIQLILYLRPIGNGYHLDVLDSSALQGDNISLNPEKVKREYGDGGYLYVGDNYEQAEDIAIQFMQEHN